MAILKITEHVASLARGHRRKLLIPGYIAWLVILTLIYFAVLPHGGVIVPIIWGLIGSTGIAGVVYRLRVTPFREALPWLCFAAAMTLFIIGDCYFQVLHFALHQLNPFPSFADVLYLLTYPLFAAGLYLLVRRRSRQRSRGNLIDALTLTMGLALFLWVYLVAPTIQSDGSTLEHAVSIAYPLGDVMVWAFLVRLLIVDVRTRSLQLLAGGALGLITSDIAYGLGQFYGTWHEGNIFTIGWVLFYGLWGLAALHTTSVNLERPLSDTPERSTMARIVALSSVAFIAPILLFITSVKGTVADVGAGIAVFAAILFALVIVRLMILTKALNQRDVTLRINREKDELLAVMSHQLRTPLTVIQLYSTQLSDALNAEARDYYMRPIVESNARMIDIVNQMIYTAQLDTGSVHFEYAPLQVADVIVHALQEVKEELKEKHIEVHTDVPLNMPQVQGDEPALAIILASVLRNSIQYCASTMPNIWVEASLRGKEVCITVDDNGQGVPAIDQPQMFTKLFRGSNARALEPNGSGLSLYIARKILSRIGGSISMSPEQAVGTRVTITLTVAKSGACPHCKTLSLDSGASAAETSGQELQKLVPLA